MSDILHLRESLDESSYTWCGELTFESTGEIDLVTCPKCLAEFRKGDQDE